MEFEIHDVGRSSPEYSLQSDWFGEVLSKDLYTPDKFARYSIDRISELGTSFLVYGREHIPKRLAVQSWTEEISAPVYHLSVKECHQEYLNTTKTFSQVIRERYAKMADEDNPPVVIIDDLNYFDTQSYIDQGCSIHHLGREVETNYPTSLLVVGVYDGIQVPEKRTDEEHGTKLEMVSVPDSYLVYGFPAVHKIEFPTDEERKELIREELREAPYPHTLDNDIQALSNLCWGMSRSRISSTISKANDFASDHSGDAITFIDMKNAVSTEVDQPERV